MSTPPLPTQQPVETPIPEKTATESLSDALKSRFSTVGGIMISVMVIIAILLPAIGAAKLSHDKFGSIGWAILAFIFAPFYYVFYAFFISSKPVIQQPILGGRRRR